METAIAHWQAIGDTLRKTSGRDPPDPVALGHLWQTILEGRECRDFDHFGAFFFTFGDARTAIAVSIEGCQRLVKKEAKKNRRKAGQKVAKTSLSKFDDLPFDPVTLTYISYSTVDRTRTR